MNWRQPGGKATCLVVISTLERPMKQREVYSPGWHREEGHRCDPKLVKAIRVAFCSSAPLVVGADDIHRRGPHSSKGLISYLCDVNQILGCLAALQEHPL